MTEDFRKNQRFAKKAMMRYRCGFFAPVTDTITKDISLNGICFYSNKKLKVGQKINVTIFDNMHAAHRKFKGCIMWSRPSHDEESSDYLNGLTII